MSALNLATRVATVVAAAAKAEVMFSCRFRNANIAFDDQACAQQERQER